MNLRAVPARLRRRLVLDNDIRRLRSEHGAAFADGETESDAPVVLIVSLSEFVYQLKLEGLLGKALQLQGRRPVVLVPPGSWIPPKYLGVLGLGELVSLDVDADARAEAEAEAGRILTSRPSVVELKGLRFRGAAVGRHVLSTLSRALHEGAVDLSEARAQTKLRELLETTLAATVTAERLLDDLQPELVLFLERNYAAEAPLSDLALERGIDVIQFVSGFRDDELVFKRYTRETRRLHPRSLSEASWERVRAMPWTERHERELDEEFAQRYGNASALSRRIQGWTRDMSRDHVLRSLGLDSGKKTAVVFSHILWDANMFYGDDLFADQEEWFVETARVACANDRVNWIFKLHPANVWKLRREGLGGELDEEKAIRTAVGDLPAHVALVRPESEISTRSIFDATDFGVTIRGSVGFELPCFGVPVLTAGTGFYSGRGFTIAAARARAGRARAPPRVCPLPAASASVHELHGDDQAARGDGSPARSRRRDPSGESRGPRARPRPADLRRLGARLASA
jgi:hypothetical protein